MTSIQPNHLESGNSFTPNTYQNLTEREKQLQASIWAINFLLAELASGLLALRYKLVDKGLLTAAEDEGMAEAILNPANLQKMYENVELAFAEKYQKVRFAADHPEEAMKEVEERRKALENV